jgi:hypothetical protein
MASKQLLMDVLKTGSGKDIGLKVRTKIPEIIAYIGMLASTDVVHLRSPGADGTVLAAAFNGAQIDYPRNVIITSGTVTGTVTINGIDQYGDTVQEILTITSGGTTTGAQAFAFITSIVYDVATGTGNISTQMGSKVGLPVDLSYTGLKSVSKSSGVTAFVAALGSGYTVSEAYDTVQLTTILAAESYIFVVA